MTTTGIVAGTWAAKDSQIAYPAPAASTSVASSTPSPAAVREERVSRNQTDSRPSLTPKVKAPKAKKATKPKAEVKAKADVVKKIVYPTPALTVTGSKYATVALNIRTKPVQDATVVTVVKTGTKLKITGSVYKEFRFVSYAGTGRWVKDQYLSATKPKPKPTESTSGGGISGAACKSGTKVESGLTPDAIRVHRALCARYPQISAFGGRRASSDFHGSGQALDSMISNSTVGWQIANWVRANAKRLGVSEVIYSQKIWTVQRGSEGWRSMSDRGSATANHYDHVHVSVYGSRGTA